ncbi:hypothetical protein C2G38_2229738 [Gigaspora rosea]|uniref:Uncharacterized protein n=1 Tax=Gigaspora rosea TaxID=44941 RepID=A0A397TUQ8_9GLOM|nr:hypothetical protein C2G38_2229738 [Gigaspora rosea]
MLGDALLLINVCVQLLKFSASVVGYSLVSWGGLLGVKVDGSNLNLNLIKYLIQIFEDQIKLRNPSVYPLSDSAAFREMQKIIVPVTGVVEKMFMMPQSETPMKISGEILQIRKND